MNSQTVRPGVDKSRDVSVGVRNHQVNVQWQLGDRTNRLHHQGTDGDVRNEVAIHHVNMQKMCPGLFYLADILTERGEVRGENGRRNPDAHWLTSKKMVSVLDNRYPACGFC